MATKFVLKKGLWVYLTNLLKVILYERKKILNVNPTHISPTRLGMCGG